MQKIKDVWGKEDGPQPKLARNWVTPPSKSEQYIQNRSEQISWKESWGKPPQQAWLTRTGEASKTEDEQVLTKTTAAQTETNRRLTTSSLLQWFYIYVKRSLFGIFDTINKETVPPVLSGTQFPRVHSRWAQTNICFLTNDIFIKLIRLVFFLLVMFVLVSNSKRLIWIQTEGDSSTPQQVDH